MNQSTWKKNIEYIEAELLRRGEDPTASSITKRFSTGLSTTIHHFFAEPKSYLPEKALTVEHRAFSHSLQLYDVQAVMRLVANYDASQGLKVILPGIEKSVQSLMVVSQLKLFTKTPREANALKAYQKRLEESLVRVLKCDLEELYDEDILAEKMVGVTDADEKLHNGFFSERLRALFSVNYRLYLILKNRLFLDRLERSQKNPQILNWQTFRLQKLIAHYQKKEQAPEIKLKEELDFRILEHLVKEQILKFGERFPKEKKVKAPVRQKKSQPFTEKDEFIIDKIKSETKDEPDKQEKVEEKENQILNSELNPKEEEQKTVQSLRPDPLENATPYEKLCFEYKTPIEFLSTNLKPVDESTAPFFKPRTEQYTSDNAEFFHKIFNDQQEVIAANRHFVEEMLAQRGREYHAIERWSVVEKSEEDQESIYLRKAPGVAPVMDRKSEWSLSLQSKLPFKIRFPLEKGRTVDLEKNRSCVFQIGTSFFDQDLLSERDDQPTGFFKLMFGGHVLTHKTSVVYVGNKPFFTITKEQTWRCRGLNLLFLMAASHRFAIELSSSLKNFLVEQVPNTVRANGAMPLKAALPIFLQDQSDNKE